MQRRVLGISPEKLADKLGIATAQLQKYETGTNRVSASRLQQIALALKVTPAFFFDMSQINSPLIEKFISSRQGIALSRAFVKIVDRKIRRNILTLVELIARM